MATEIGGSKGEDFALGSTKPASELVIRFSFHIGSRAARLRVNVDVQAFCQSLDLDVFIYALLVLLDGNDANGLSHAYFLDGFVVPLCNGLVDAAHISLAALSEAFRELLAQAEELGTRYFAVFKRLKQTAQYLDLVATAFLYRGCQTLAVRWQWGWKWGWRPHPTAQVPPRDAQARHRW